MLVLSRKIGEVIVIGEGANTVKVILVEIVDGKARIGINAPRSIPVWREELLDEDGKRKPK